MMEDNGEYITINLIQNENRQQNLKTICDVNEIVQDIQMYRNQLKETRGSIRIQASSSQSKRCCCGDEQSTDICQKIIKFENELFLSNSVEYIYDIESITNKTTAILN